MASLLNVTNFQGRSDSNTSQTPTDRGQAMNIIELILWIHNSPDPKTSGRHKKNTDQSWWCRTIKKKSFKNILSNQIQDNKMKEIIHHTGWKIGSIYSNY